MKKLIALIPTGGKSKKQIRKEAMEALEAIGGEEKKALQGTLSAQTFDCVGPKRIINPLTEKS